MRVLVCGGREFDDYKAMQLVLDAQHEGEPITLLIHGDAVGADRLAARWARSRGVVARLWDSVCGKLHMPGYSKDGGEQQ